MTDVSFCPRKSAGVPVGGEFTAYAHQDPTVSLGRHAAPASNRAVPESLRMAHFQDPDLAYNLEWAVEGSFRPGAPADYHAENFSDHLRNLHYEESANYYSKACQAYADGGDWKAVIAEAAAADTALHPGGKLADGYTPPVAEHLPGPAERFRRRQAVALSRVRIEEVRSSNLLSSTNFTVPVQAGSWKLRFPAAIRAREQERSEVAGMRLGPPMAGIDVGNGELRYPVFQAVCDVR
jgi:hypothetical protein